MLVDVHAAGLNFFEWVPLQSYKSQHSRYISLRPAHSILLAQGRYQSMFPSAQSHDDHLTPSARPPLPFVLGAEFAGVISASSPIPKGCPYSPGGTSAVISPLRKSED